MRIRKNQRKNLPKEKNMAEEGKKKRKADLQKK